jgi:hypothetical protein
MAASGSDTGDLASGIAARAGAWLEINYAGGAKDKRIARDLGISPGMAKQLRGGRGWTVARLDQVIGLWPAFRDFVFPPPDRLDQLAERFARLADELALLRVELRDDIRGMRDDISAMRGDLQRLRGRRE